MYRIPFSLVTLFLLAAASSDVDKAPYTHYRLPESIRPDIYHLKIITNLDEATNFTFNGEVSIRFLTLEDTRNITLHVQNLTVDDTRIELHSYNDSDFSLCLESVDRVSDLNYYVIGLCQTLSKDQMYELKLYFTGVLNDEMRGYYRSSYVDESTNVTKWLSVTQFEPLSARRAFPCLDEPNYKAKFIIWLGHHKSFTALSNMPLEKQIPLDDLEDFVWSIFEESVPMSTYLVAYTVNDFVYKETKLEGSDVVFRTWCRRDCSHQCEFAADVAPNILKFYEEMFKIPFPLKKVDQLAVPDFLTVAMENWGLITYQEDIFLSGPNDTSSETDLSIVKVVAHELAHQWFGNLVTMKWWTDVWLNEGFATYIASLGASSLSPELKSYNMDSFHNSVEIFVKDAELSSHPISQTLSNCSEIMTRFDSISYKKGSAVLRMMHMSMGHDWFFGGVCLYLNKHKYENAEQDDLWEAFTESGHQFESIRSQSNMKIIMDSWTLQAGYPLIKVERNYETGSIDISQQRFLRNSSIPDEESRKCWWVPLSYTTASELQFTSTLPKAWLECDESGSRIPLKLDNVIGANDWIIFNIQLSGVYRVMYDLENWRLITNTLNSERFEDIHVLNRAQILDDLWTMTWNGYQHYTIYLAALEYLHRERETLPWETVLENLWELHNMLKPFPEHLSYFRSFMRYIIEPMYHHLGGLKDTKEMIDINTDLIRWACRVELEDCVQTALIHFQQWKLSANPKENNTIPDNLKQIVYCTAILHGNNDDWTFLWQRYNESQDEEMLIALGCSRNQTLLRELLDLFYAEETHLEQGDLTVFYSMAINDVGVRIAREYIFDRISKWSENFDLSDLLMVSFHIVFPEDLNILNNLIDSNEEYFKQYNESLKLTYDKLHFKLQWMEHNLDDVKSYLQNRLPQMGIIENNVIDQET